MKHNELTGYTMTYTDSGFWKKAKSYSKSVGKVMLERVLQLYFAAQAPATPIWAKTVIYGALGYFISVFDALPDITPIVGYTDDLGVLAAAITAVAVHITPEIQQKATAKVNQWFSGL